MKIIKKELIEQDELNYYDLKIPNTHNFILSSGIVAHNCGTGVTFGLSRKTIDLLPNLVGPEDKTGTVLPYIIDDTIEGWADSLEALLMCYFKNTPFTGRKIVFDYSKIRRKGSPLKIGGGKAPGHKGLKLAHEKIKELLDHIIEIENVKRMHPIHAYDIMMHASDAVLSGGIRRAACAAIFDKDDEEMLNAKTNFKVTSYRNFQHIEDTVYYDGFVFVNGKKYEVKLSEFEYQNLKTNKEISWSHIEPQRARSNNSVLLIRGETTFEEFNKIVERTKSWGEPGFVWANHPMTLFNPCITADTKIETDRGELTPPEIQKFMDNKEAVFALSYNEDADKAEYKQILASEQTNPNAEIIEIETDDGSVLSLTPNHKVLVEGRGWVEAAKLSEDDILLSFE